MLLRRAVGLTVIVTEKYKSSLLSELRAAMQRIDAARGQIQFQLDRYVNEIAKTDLNQASQLRERLNAEKERLTEARSEMDARLREVEKLDIGGEYQRGTLEGVVEVEIGDNLFQKLGGTTVVIKDSVVIEFREQQEPLEEQAIAEEIVGEEARV